MAVDDNASGAPSSRVRQPPRAPPPSPDPFQGLVAGPAGAAPVGQLGGPAFRGLRPIPDQRDGKVRLHLPEGFRYRSFHDTETPVALDDGTKLPGRHDGMGAFEGPGGASPSSATTRSTTPGRAFGPPVAGTTSTTRWPAAAAPTSTSTARATSRPPGPRSAAR